MRYNGVDVRSIHPAISIEKEIRPGMPPWDIHTVEGTDGEILAGTRIMQGEYVARINIAGKSRAEAWEAFARLVAWAGSSRGKLAQLEPTHWQGKAYDAIIGDMQAPEFKFGFGKVELDFVIPRPIAYDVMQSTAGGTAEIIMQIGGTTRARPVLEVEAVSGDGVELTLDGTIFFAINGRVSKGDVITIDTKEGTLDVNGEPAELRIDFDRSDWRPGFWPGRHTLKTSSGIVRARWHNEWL